MTIIRITIVAFLLSILSAVAAEHLTRVVPIVGSFVSLTLVYNPGVAFSIQFPSWMQTLFITLALIGVMIAARHRSRTTVQTLAYGMTIGGALANIVDRLVDGVVTDYLSIGSFPVFNVADSFICVGIGLLLFGGGKRQETRDSRQ